MDVDEQLRVGKGSLSLWPVGVDDSYGWLWKPGYEWSPAWELGQFDNFYGWAPLMPGVNVGIAFDSWKLLHFIGIVRRDHI